MDTQTDPLDVLFTSDISRQRLADVLLKHMRIDPKTLHVVWVNDELIVKHQILLYLLARRAMRLTGRIEYEAARGSEIAEATNNKPNTVRPLLYHLEADGLVKHEDSYFHIPMKRVIDVIATLEARRK